METVQCLRRADGRFERAASIVFALFLPSCNCSYATPHIDNSTPDRAFILLTNAMEHSNQSAFVSLTTDRSRWQLNLIIGEFGSVDMQQAGIAWAAADVSWVSIGEQTSEARGLGDLMDTQFEFQKTELGWKLLSWTPGE